MTKAAIYIRVSTEQQADKVSPEAQEHDCVQYCQNHGYEVVEVYRDIERYSSNGRVVEPSGTRADRPQLRRMIEDAHNKRFDLIIAWREDRLYRSYRPMLDVLDCIDETEVDIELVKETFDKRIAPVKAWAARMELDAKRDRQIMGVAGRLANGKGWFGNPPYGYDYEDGALIVNELEAKWVQNIWKWYGEGVTMPEIRKRLVAAGVPQKGVARRKYTWALGCIRPILKRDGYYTGYLTVNWNKEKYDIPIPTIIDAKTYQAVKDRFAAWKAYPAGNYKSNTLAAGVIYCDSCDVKMGVVRITKPSNNTYYYYRCNNLRHAISTKNCARNVSAKNVDEEIWDKVWTLISKPGKFEAELQALITQLQSEGIDAGIECEDIERQLEETAFERQKVITWARKKIITEDDLEIQLHALDDFKDELEKELAEKRLLTGDRAERLIKLASLYRRRVNRGWAELAGLPESPEKEDKIFEYKKMIVDSLMVRVNVYKDKSSQVITEPDWQVVSEELCISEPSLR